MQSFKPEQAIRGFSLIELMIVIVIFGVLFGIAIPSYNDHINKTRVIEVLSIAEACQNKLYHYFIKTGNLPDGSSTQLVNCHNLNLNNIYQSIPSNNNISIAYSKNFNAKLTLKHNSIVHATSGAACLIQIEFSPQQNNDLILNCKTDCSQNYFPKHCATGQTNITI